jgi:hypothetical protein
LVIVVMVAAASALEFAISDGGRSVVGWLYLALPLVVVVVALAAALRKPCD